ncbi:hypothetical protein SDC9_124553 [bioreactor metagenome]|uniref:Alpha/beta hydrolase n=1 Tax=bioreactor metagenome TaxID=1076179 RepID=A0A645CKT9_9ZZZZ|nr:alpha/beta hydrolase [Paludibacter sp.]
MTNFFIIPGYQGSGPDHWQSWLENTQPNFRRIHQKDWNSPDIDEWAENIDNAISGAGDNMVILVAHSLGCHAVAHWAKRYRRTIGAALLVAPPDIDLISRKVNAQLFEVPPLWQLPFRSTVVASSNDPWIDINKAELYARKWGSDFLNIGDAGHINHLSGHGEWRQGLELLRRIG